MSTLVISQNDRRGVISDVSRVLFGREWHEHRHHEGEPKCPGRNRWYYNFETDGILCNTVVERMKQVNNVLSVRH